MKFKKEIITILLIICVLFTISAISAADSGDEAVSVANDTVKVTGVNVNSENNLQKSNDDVEILGDTDDGSFAALNTKISGATAGLPVYLENDYEYKSTDSGTSGINISQAITIDGQGHKIDAKGISKIFTLKASDVVFKNITFANGYAASGPAVISSNQLYYMVDGCTFINNNGQYGAIYTYYTGAAIKNSIFIKNTGTPAGAINWNYAWGTIDNCTFVNNTGTSGGSIFIQSYYSTTIQNSIFANNVGDVDIRGIKYWQSINANNNWFGTTIDNYQTSTPSVSSDVVMGGYYVLNMELDEDNGQAAVSLNNLYKDGVLTTNAPYTLPSLKFKVKGTNVDVVDNVVLDNDGKATIDYTPTDAYAITVDYNGAKLTKEVIPTFILLQNKINNDVSGEVSLDQDYVYDSTKDASLTNGVEFAKDMVIDGKGHIIDAKGLSNIFYFDDDTDSKNLILKNIIFKNAIGADGAVVYFKGNKIEVINCTFINNAASGQGDALYIIANSNENKITESFFAGNSGSNSLIYFDTNTEATIDNSIFYNNSASKNIVGSGAVTADYNWWGNTIENFNVNIAKADGATVNNWLFLKIDADAAVRGYATVSLNNIYDGSQTGTYSDYDLPTVSLNLAGSNVAISKTAVTLDENGQDTYQFIMYKTTATLTASYNDISTAKDIEYVIVDDGSFNALNDILWFAESDVTLDKNYTFIEGVDTVTGGMTIRNTITINGNGFTINGKGKAALLNIPASGVVLNDLILINGVATNGGAIYLDGESLEVNNCIFINNSATESGGAIYSNAYYNMGYITGSTFINNSAPTQGSAIFNYADAGDVYQCIFINNTGTYTIYEQYSQGTISHSIFANNNDDYQVYGKKDKLEYNWFGNTYDNYNLVPTKTYISTIPNWFYLDIQFLDNYAIISLNHIYDKVSQTTQLYRQYKLPEITLNINSTTLNLDTDKVTLDNTGKAMVSYTKLSDDAALTVNYGEISLTKECVMGDFDVLQAIVDLANHNNVINLTRNYTYIEGVDTITNGISIPTQITIDGKGHTIDAKGLSRIFYFSDTNRYYNLILQNINFVNGKSTKGGSVYFLGKNIDIINCTFENSTSTDHGGAVYLDDSGTNIINSTFIKNAINVNSKYGGAVYIQENGGQNNFINSTFINNTVNYWGGAIAALGGKAINNVDKCIFITNGGGSGKSIYIGSASSTASEFYLKNSIILSNDILDSGNQVYALGTFKASEVDNNWLMNTIDNYNTNYARISGGGMTVNKWLYLDITCENEVATISINNVYDKNTRTTSKYDGELPKITFDLTALNAVLPNNVTLDKTGEVDVPYDLYSQTDSLTAKYHTVSLTKEITMDDSFTSLAGKISRADEGSTLTLSHDYKYDAAKDSALVNGIEFGKTLTIDGQGHTLDGQNTARIFNFNDDTKDIILKNIKFVNAKSDENGAAVYANCNNIQVLNCTFEHNDATANGDALYLIANSADISKSLFINNLGTASVIYLDSASQGAQFNIDNSIFVNNDASSVIKTDNVDLTADYNWFGNTADISGSDLSGGIATKWYVLDMTVDDEKSLATITLNNLYDGTAVNPYENYVLPQITLNMQSSNAVTKKDKVTLDENGAATVEYIVTDDSGQGTLTAEYNGVKITRDIAYNLENDYSFKALQKLINEADPNDVISLTHDYEFVVGYDEGQIEIRKENLTIEGNGHVLDGKEQTRIFNVGDPSSYLLINNLTFINGKTSGSDMGAAINWHSYYGNITNCVFINNSAYDGGAINANYYVNIFNCTFSENYASQHGGAIRVQKNNVSIDKCAFINNDGKYLWCNLLVWWN